MDGASRWPQGASRAGGKARWAGAGRPPRGHLRPGSPAWPAGPRGREEEAVIPPRGFKDIEHAGAMSSRGRSP